MRSKRGTRAAIAARSELLVPAVIVLVAALAIAGYVATYAHYLDLNLYPVVRSDGVGYYAYLPAWIIDHDPSLRHVVTVDFGSQNIASLNLQPSTGSYLDEFPVGEAIMLLPFFVAGHVTALLIGVDANGFSRPEELAVGLGGVFYMVAGLAVLGRALARRFSPRVTAASLVAITFGANLFHYGTFDSMFSHAFSFFLVACLVESSRHWYLSQRRIQPSVLLGANLGAIVLVRNVNAVFVLVPALYGVWNAQTLRERLEWLREHRWRLPPVAVSACAVFVPQLVVWKVATGGWITNSYQDVHFDLLHPHILDTLFSFDPHGFLPWAPIMALALAGLIWLRRYAPELFLPTCATFAVMTYLVACWNTPGPDWFFGGGYGDRAFIDTFPLLAFGLAALFARAGEGLKGRVVAVAAVASCVLATVQMLHYWRLIVPFNGASFDEYVHFLPRRIW